MTYPRRVLGELVWLVSLLCCSAAGAANPPPMALIGRCEAPRVDGRLDDACWRDAAVLAPFLLNDASGPASQQTVARAIPPAGRRVPLTRRLEPGESVLAVVAPGGARLSGSLACGTQSIPVGEGWRWAEAPGGGWDRPGFAADGWRSLRAGAG